MYVSWVIATVKHCLVTLSRDSIEVNQGAVITKNMLIM